MPGSNLLPALNALFAVVAFAVIFWSGLGWLFPAAFLKGPLRQIPTENNSWGKRHYFTNPMLAAMVLDSLRRSWVSPDGAAPSWLMGTAALCALPVLATTLAPWYRALGGRNRLTSWAWNVYRDESQGRVHHLLWAVPLFGSLLVTAYPHFIRHLEKL